MVIKVKVTPNSKKPGVVGWVDNMVYIKVAAPPVDGKANKQVCKVLAELLMVPISSVNIKSGQTSKIKTVEISNIDEEQLFAILSQQPKLPI